MITWKKAAVAVATVGTAVAGTLAFASPALANPHRCVIVGSDSQSQCAYVIGISPGSVLNIRSGPGSNFADVGDLHNGEEVEVECWTTGTRVNGYNIWTQIYSPGAPRYVSDFYLDTGHVQDQLRECGH